jgi:hypothetical protein
MSPDDKNLEILEAIFHEAALVEAEEGESTPEQKQKAAAIMSRLDARVADLRRNLAVTPSKPARPIRPSILAMTRDALIAALDALTSNAQVQVAHRNLSTLSDDDLRRLLESLTPESE